MEFGKKMFRGLYDNSSLTNVVKLARKLKMLVLEEDSSVEKLLFIKLSHWRFGQLPRAGEMGPEKRFCERSNLESMEALEMD